MMIQGNRDNRMVSGSQEIQGFRKLYEFSRLLLEGDDPENLLNRLVKATQVITDADEVLLLMIEGGDPVVRAVASEHPGGSGEDSARRLEDVKYSESLVDAVVERGAPLLLDDVSDDPRFEDSQSIQVLSITSAMGAPLFDEGSLTGVLYASRKRMTENFSENHRELMTVAASQASLLLGRLASVEALRESEVRYRSLVEMSPSAIVVVQDRSVKFANPRACRLWSRESMAELVGTEVGDLFDPWRSQGLLRALRDNRSFESVDAWVWDGSDDGLPVEVVGEPVDKEGSRAMQLIISEIAAHDEVLNRRVRADRLMVMGMMAATVSHEINNPLSYIGANLEYALEELEVTCPEAAQSDIIKGLRSARDGAERIRGIVESMQDFTRLDNDDEEPTTVERPLKSSLRIAQNELDSDVDLEVDIEPVPPVPVCAARLGQVFLNLLINAAQALADVDGGDKRLSIDVDFQDSMVVVEIADNGPGIDPEVRDHIFEPFVSTKSGESGSKSGSGLGLAICNDIVEAAGGRIDVESRPGAGSLFRICFPPVEDGPESGEHHVEGDDSTPRARVLIVDPEPLLCRSLERGLRGQHDVTAVSSKGRAIEALDGVQEFDVILCDLRLRGGLGRDLFEWVRQEAPDYWDRLVAMTSNPRPRGGDNYLDNLSNPGISKPFELQQLRTVIGEIVGERRSTNSSQERSDSEAGC